MKFWNVFLTAIVLTTLTPARGAASATAVYIAQTAAGSANGSNCTNAYPVTFFNTSGNWGSGASQIGPGTTVHLCGTISSPLWALGSGSSGSPVTILFEPGAIISNTGTVWNAQSPITLDGQNYITINGGTANIGGASVNLQATGNGSGLATQLAILGIHMNYSSNVEIINFGCGPLYLHTSVSDDKPGADSTACVYANANGNNISIHDSTFHDSADGILFPTATSGSNMLQLYNMNMYNLDHSLFTTCDASGSSGWYIHDNQWHDYVNWDTTDNVFHHDGWLMNINTGQKCDQVYFYNNLISGDFGANNTSPLFFDQNGGAAASVNNTYVFNNVFLNTNTTGANGWSNGIAINSSPGPTRFWNNTVICPVVGGPALEIAGTNMDVRNNVESGCADFINTSLATSGVTAAAFDYNHYANSVSSGGPTFSFMNSTSRSGSLATQFAAWQTVIQGYLSGAESHSGASASAGLNANGTVQTGSPLMGAGVNLCNGIISCTGTLAALMSGTSAGNTIMPVARSASGAWDKGAYAYAGSGTAVPTNLSVSVR